MSQKFSAKGIKVVSFKCVNCNASDLCIYGTWMKADTTCVSKLALLNSCDVYKFTFKVSSPILHSLLTKKNNDNKDMQHKTNAYAKSLSSLTQLRTIKLELKAHPSSIYRSIDIFTSGLENRTWLAVLTILGEYLSLDFAIATIFLTPPTLRTCLGEVKTQFLSNVCRRCWPIRKAKRKKVKYTLHWCSTRLYKRGHDELYYSGSLTNFPTAYRT